MKDNVTQVLARHARTFQAFTSGQKVVAVVGTLALLLAGFMVFRWASTPSMVPLYSGLSGEDASAVVEELTAAGTPYELAAGGTTIMVPQDSVAATKIALAGEGLPSGAGAGGYALLDGQSLSTSEFQERTGFKRAMEGELATTIEAIDGVETAVVHLAMPERQVFSDTQDPTTASVLVDTTTGTDLGPEQVQAVVNLVASSIDGLDTDNVTVADSQGRVLSAPAGSAGAMASTRSQQEAEVQRMMTTQIQSMLDRVVGVGNSTVTVTPTLDFDKAVVESKTYNASEGVPPISESRQRETYTGPAGTGGVGGVVGPDGQMEPGAGGQGGESSYEKRAEVLDNPVGTVVERRETAPGSIEKLGIGVVLDATTTAAIDPAQIQQLVASATGVDTARGDQITVSSMPFNREAEESMAADLEAAEAEAAAAGRMDLYRNAGLAGLVLLLLLLAWLRGRRRAKQRTEATSLVVEQLRADALARATAAQQAELSAASPALAALEQADHDATDDLRDELASLVEKQPEDVAALLRGWLVEPR